MYSITVYSVLVAALFAFVGAQTTTEPITGTLGNATTVEDNPPGLIYTATLPTKEFFNSKDPRGNVKGSVSATANPNGIGVSFSVSFSNLPTSGGPFRMFSSAKWCTLTKIASSLPHPCCPCPWGWKLHGNARPSWSLHSRRGKLLPTRSIDEQIWLL
jgi:hypothetical protein